MYLKYLKYWTKWWGCISPISIWVCAPTALNSHGCCKLTTEKQAQCPPQRHPIWKWIQYLPDAFWTFWVLLVGQVGDPYLLVAAIDHLQSLYSGLNAVSNNIHQLSSSRKNVSTVSSHAVIVCYLFRNMFALQKHSELLKLVELGWFHAKVACAAMIKDTKDAKRNMTRRSNRTILSNEGLMAEARLTERQAGHTKNFWILILYP